VEFVDHCFGRVLDSLEATGQLSNTLIIFTSDHGEALGDHGLNFKGCRFYEGLSHVPLIYSLPGTVQAGRRSTALRRTPIASSFAPNTTMFWICRMARMPT
jgi:arylsulfatase